jgi:hypothetical protein
MFPTLAIVEPDSWQPDDGPEAVFTISNAVLAIIDCSQGINSQAMELGIAAATLKERVVEVWSTKADTRLNPVSMYPGRRFAWSDMGPGETAGLRELLEDLVRASELGVHAR